MDPPKGFCSKNIKELHKLLKETLNIDLKFKCSNGKDIEDKAAAIPTTKIEPKIFKKQFNEGVVKKLCGYLSKELKWCSSVRINISAEGAVQTLNQCHKKALTFTEGLSNPVKKLVKECTLPQSQRPTSDATIMCETSNAEKETYPKLANCYPPAVVIGPNGTRVSEKYFNKIDWKTCQGATRKLSGLIFSREDILDIDFAENILDPDKLADMEHCILAKTNGTTLQIRQAFSKKFIDTHLKFNKNLYK